MKLVETTKSPGLSWSQVDRGHAPEGKQMDAVLEFEEQLELVSKSILPDSRDDPLSDLSHAFLSCSLLSRRSWK